MKKIMFNDRFGLTDAVLDGRKPVTRRIITPQPQIFYNCNHGVPVMNSEGLYVARLSKDDIGETSYIKPPYKVGEVVAIAQSYQDIGLGDDGSAAWTNKMFVKAAMMPHRIDILDVRVERLQDITDEDCIKEGIEEMPFGWVYFDSKVKLSGGCQSFGSPREAFAELIDKISGKGTWESNPYVFRNEFKLK